MSILSEDYVTRFTSQGENSAKLTYEFSNAENITWTSRLQHYLNFLRGEGYLIPNGAVAINTHKSVWGSSENELPDETKWYEGIVCVDSQANNNSSSTHDISKVFPDEISMLSFIRESTAMLDYESIMKTMQALGWNYFNGPPTEKRLQEIVFNVSESAIKQWFENNVPVNIETSCSTGGFTAEFTMTEFSEPWLKVYFAVCESTTTLYD